MSSTVRLPTAAALTATPIIPRSLLPFWLADVGEQQLLTPGQDCNAPICGAVALRDFFDATRAMYDSISFVHEFNAGSRTCLSQPRSDRRDRTNSPLSPAVSSSSGLLGRTEPPNGRDPLIAFVYGTVEDVMYRLDDSRAAANEALSVSVYQRTRNRKEGDHVGSQGSKT